MPQHPTRCPFCGNTVLAPAGETDWTCVGILGCGGRWDPAVLVAAPPRLDPVEPDPEPERGRRPLRLRPARKLARGAATVPRTMDAA